MSIVPWPMPVADAGGRDRCRSECFAALNNQIVTDFSVASAENVDRLAEVASRKIDRQRIVAVEQIEVDFRARDGCKWYGDRSRINSDGAGNICRQRTARIGDDELAIGHIGHDGQCVVGVSAVDVCDE